MEQRRGFVETVRNTAIAVVLATGAVGLAGCGAEAPAQPHPTGVESTRTPNTTPQTLPIGTPEGPETTIPTTPYCDEFDGIKDISPCLDREQ